VAMAGVMAGWFPVVALQEPSEALAELAASRDRAEVDRARAIVLTLEDWTSAPSTSSIALVVSRIAFHA
jgi:hypothetical protein